MPSSWKSYEHGDDVHVMPVVFPAHEFQDCWCDPTKTAGPPLKAGMVYHHWSRDDEEFV